MGDPKLLRRLYARPAHPWKGERIREEKELVKKFGLTKKREIWKTAYKLKNYRKQARDLLAIAAPTPHQSKQKTNLISRLRRYGMLDLGATDLGSVLGLTTEDILSRRLQSQCYFKGLASTLKQSRQFITHGHISVGGRKITVPSYLVSVREEDTITYNSNSPLLNELHPMRPSVGGQFEHVSVIATPTSAPTPEEEPSGKPPVKEAPGDEKSATNGEQSPSTPETTGSKEQKEAGDGE